MLGPDSAKQWCVCTHRFACFIRSRLDAFVISGSRVFSSLIDNNPVASLSDIYSRETKTEQLESQHD